LAAVSTVSELTALQTYAGACHCGEIRFEIETDLPELTTCDCSICRRKNALMVKVHESAFRLLHRKRVTPDHYGVNVFCLEDFDRAGILVRATAGAAMP
jgi:hypothetical protein